MIDDCPQMKINHAQMLDYPHIIRLLNILAKGEEMSCMLNVAQLAGALQCDNPKLEALVAKDDGQVFGCALFYRGFDVLSASYGTHISDIIVHEDIRGQKIGRKLMQKISEYTVENGGEWLSLTVDKRNARAKNFYLSIGAELINVDFMAMGITNMRILMEKL